MEKSREATDLANVRAAYAEVMTCAISESNADNPDITVGDSGGKKTYTATVQLTQKKNGFQTTGEIVIGGISSVADENTYWFNYPQALGTCTITYTEGIAKPKIDWGGAFKGYMTTIQDAVYANTDFGGYKKSSNTLNSTYASASTKFANILQAIDDAGFTEIKTWAAVRDPADLTTDLTTAPGKKFNYLMSTVDIKTVNRGDKVPVLYLSKDGDYSIGYATVSKAPDGNYNVITVDPNGKYNTGADKPYYDANYKSISLVDERQDFGSNKYAAEAAYAKLVEEYNAK
ncbi:MAG: hypothetical protein Q4B60_01845 [Erysipelotrichaceae bacterium]|nr:hypothetical protein [Erysipelotrichaceae bacterium]